ncbi:MAG: hypothetical protein R3A79_05895 [Nannocystaceae bacterium]
MSPVDSPRWRAARCRRPLALVVAAALLGAGAPAQASDASAEATASDAVNDPLPEVNRNLKEAATKTSQGHHVAAADLLIAAYDLLDDPRRFRNERSSVMSMIYAALLAAYESAESDAAKLSRGCRLRGLLTEFITDLQDSYGDDSESFNEVINARDKLQSLDLMLAAHGDPAAVCATYDGGPRRAIPMLDPAKPSRSTLRMGGAPARGGFSPGADDLTQPGKGMTAVGGALLGLGAIGLGVMTPFLVRGSQMVAEIEAINDNLATRDDPRRTPEEQAEADYYHLRGKEANRIAIATGVTGGAALIAGAVLVAMGRKRTRSSAMSVAPQVSPTAAGLTLHLRF